MLIGPHGSIVCYNFAPASISLGERPFPYDIIGSLKISLSNSCSSIKRHLLGPEDFIINEDFFKFGTFGC